MMDSSDNLTALPRAGLLDNAGDSLFQPPEEEAYILNGRALELYGMSDVTGSRDDLEESISMMRKVMSLIPTDHVDRAMYDINLAEALFALRQFVTSRDVLDEAFAFAHEAIRCVQDGPWERLRCFHGILRMFYTLYESWGDVRYLKESISGARYIARETDCGDAVRAAYLNTLGIMLGQLFRYTNDEKDLRQAIGEMEEAVRLTSDVDAPTRPLYVSNLARGWLHLGASLLESHQDTQDVSYLDEGIAALHEVIRSEPDGRAQQVAWIQLGDAMEEKYNETGLLSHLDGAIDAAKTVIWVTIEEFKDDAVASYIQLTARYERRFRSTNSAADLDEAINIGIVGLDATPDQHPLRGQLLHNIGARFFDHFDRTGSPAYLKQALTYVRQTASYIPKDSPDWPIAATSFATGLETHFMLTGALADLEEAIEMATEVLEAAHVHATPAERLVYAHNLATYLGHRYRRTHQPSDLDKQIELYTDVVKGSREGGELHSKYLASLGDALVSRFQSSGAYEDLDKAIALFGQALNTMTVTSHASQADIWHSAASALGLSSKTAAPVDDPEALVHLDGTIGCLTKAASLLDSDHPLRSLVFLSLGAYLGWRHQLKGNEDDARAMRDCFRHALEQIQSPPGERIDAGRRLMLDYMEASMWQEAYQACQRSIDLIPQLIPRFASDHSDKQDALGQWNGLASECAALALQTGERPVTALVALEKGRGLFASSLEDLSANLAALKTEHPQLAQRFLSLQREVRASSSEHEPLSEGERENADTAGWARDSNQRRREVDGAFEALAVEIRECPGFEHFLLPVSEADVCRAAEGGPVVIVNSSLFRCDAIIVEKHQVTSIPLPRYRRSTVNTYLGAGTMNTPEALEWLWNCIAGPVLDALGIAQPPADGHWPHVWWVMPGLLSKVPIHAAGYHRQQHSSRTVLDRVISSYHPTVTSIVRTRRRPFQSDAAGVGQALLVGMETTGGSRRLRFVPQEISTVQTLCASLSLQPVVEKKPDKGRILSQLPTCSVFHFAGHGINNYSRPLQSHLALGRGRDNSITVEDLLSLNLFASPPLMAYLSACGTSQVKNPSYTDESFHIMSGCLLAGFRHIIGTLWAVEDAVCVDMARLTYEGLQDLGLCEASVSWALHKAIRTLRDNWLSSIEKGSALDGRRGVVPHGGSTNEASDDEGRQRGVRTVEPADDGDQEPLAWVPFIHYGL